MAREDVQGVLQALAQAHLRGIERTRVQNEAIAQQQRGEQEEKRIELEKERITNEHEHQQAILKATQATLKLQHVKALQDITAGIQGGTPVPGASVSDVPGTGGTAQLHVIHDEEGKPLASVMLPGREEFARQQAATEETLQAPKTAARISEIEAQGKQRAAEISLAKEADDKRAEMMRKSAELVGRGHDAARIAAAQITHQGTPLDPEVADKYTQDAISGELTLGDFQKAIPDKGQRAAVQNAVIGSGANFFTEKQKKIKGDFASAAQLIPQFDQANALLKSNPVAARNPLTEIGKEYAQIQAQIKEKLINSLTAFGQSGRLSDPRVKAVNDAFNATQTMNPFVDPLKLNAKAKEAFVNYLDDTVDKQLSSLSTGQRAKVKLDLGIHSGGQAPGPITQQPQTAPGVTHRFNPQTGQVEPVQPTVQ